MKDLFKKAREYVWLEGDPLKDQSVGLIVFGILETALGVLSFCAAMFLMILTASAGLGGMKVAHFWMVMGLLFFLAGWLIVVGLGSIKARRWARVLVLVGSWVMIFFGTMLLALLLYILPGVHSMMADSGVFTPSAAMGVVYFGIILLVLLLLVVPMLSVAFFSLRGVLTTCERRNPGPCWSDNCPLPLLAMGFISVLGSLTVLFGASGNYVVFLFGRILTGWAGFAVVLPISAVCGYVGWGAFTRRIHAWWLAYAMTVLLSASMMLTFAELDMPALYRDMGYSVEQAVSLGRLELLNPATLTFVTCVWGIMACIYLVWVRDCFLPEKVQVEVKSFRQRVAEKDAARPPEPMLRRMRLED